MNEEEQLTITHSIIGKENKVAVLIMQGYIDSNTATTLKEKLLFLGNSLFRFILDFGQVEYISSAGWGVVLSRIKENRQKGGDIVFINMMKEVYSIYDLLELNKVIRYFSNVNEALEYIGEVVPAVLPITQKLGKKQRKKIEKTLTIEEAIRSIVRSNPLLNSFGIKKVLQLPEYGFSKLSVLKVYMKLRHLKLHTKTKRLYFAWQEEKKAKVR